MKWVVKNAGSISYSEFKTSEKSKPAGRPLFINGVPYHDITRQLRRRRQQYPRINTSRGKSILCSSPLKFSILLVMLAVVGNSPRFTCFGFQVGDIRTRFLSKNIDIKDRTEMKISFVYDVPKFRIGQSKSALFFHLSFISTSPSSLLDYLPIAPTSSIWTVIQGLAFTMLVPIGISLFQGATAMMNYQSNFGDAPPPKIPAHGVVIATTTNGNNIKQRSNPNAKVFSSFYDMDSNSNNNTKDVNRDFLRLLLIGDSLAVGIGQRQTCTPVMPEAIAKEISKSTGKAVFWTCHGETGASTSWIVRMLQNSTELMPNQQEDIYQPPDFINWVGKNRKFHGNYFNNGTYAAEGIWTHDDKSSDTIEIWKSRLEAFRNNFDPAAMGPYDIVVLLTGPNDLKTLLFPFLFQEDDTNIRNKDSKQKRKGVADDLMLLRQTINDKIEYRVNKTIEIYRKKAEMMLDAICEESDVLSEAVQIFKSNQTIGDKLDASIHIALDEIRVRADSITKDLQSRAESLSDAYMLLKSSNQTLPETIKSYTSFKKPFGKSTSTKTKAATITDELYQTASDAFKTLQSNYEELERLFSIASDFSQILIHDDFKLLNFTSAAKNDRMSRIEKAGTSGLIVDDKSEGVSTIRLNEVVRPGRPLFVLPGMPARALPVFQNAPLKWFAVPVFNVMDRKKIQLARSNSDILFVRDPSLRDVSDYETKRGRLWSRIVNEEILLSLKDIRQEDCNSIERSMQEYFRKKIEITKSSQRFESKIFSPDGIHPNDSGYDFFGK